MRKLRRASADRQLDGVEMRTFPMPEMGWEAAIVILKGSVSLRARIRVLYPHDDAHKNVAIEARTGTPKVIFL
jgi:uncharacterized protein (UPF0548 family)